MACSMAAPSATERVNGPTVSREWESGKTPDRLTTPYVGFMPTRPQAAAGSRMEPPVSLQSAPGTMPAATTDPDPDDDPPQI